MRHNLTESAHPVVTVAAWAQLEGISRQAAFLAVKRCAIPRDASGKVDPAVAAALYKARTRTRVRAEPQAGAAPAAPAGERTSYDEARRRQAVADATSAELRVKREAGTLVLAADVRKAWAGALVQLKDALLSFPGRLGPLLAGATQGDAQHILATEIARLLEDLACSRDGTPRAVP